MNPKPSCYKEPAPAAAPPAVSDDPSKPCDKDKEQTGAQTGQQPGGGSHQPGSGGHHPPPPSTDGENKCTSEGFFGDEENCKAFYRCVAKEDGTFSIYYFDCAVSARIIMYKVE